MSIHVDGPMPGEWKFYRSLQGGYFLQGAVGNKSGSFEIILITEDIRLADAMAIENLPGLIEALEEIKQNCDPWRKPNNMASRLFEIADSAIRRAKTERQIDYFREEV
jgi:hypothetical protein